MPLMPPEVCTKEEEERQELQAVLQSGILSKAPNLQHFLRFVAEKYFAGRTGDVKEYSIAVEALHRPQDFDPQADTIVRVTAHALRKRLQHYYETTGVNNPIQMQLPAGKYVLRFVRKLELEVSSQRQALPALLDSPRASLLRRRAIDKRAWMIGGVATAACLGICGIFLAKHGSSSQSPKARDWVSSAVIGQDSTRRILFGESRHPYIDAAGQGWSVEQYCKGGTSFSHPDRDVQGTDDQPIFREGREGKFQCKIPAPPGAYQLQLLFADTAGDKEAARQVVFSINNGSQHSVDVVDEAGGNDIAVGKVYAGIHPASDGAIHLDFSSEGSFVNAAELTPSEAEEARPLRMVAGPAVFHDYEGNTWLPERFFIGGRRAFHPDNLPKVVNAKLFGWERYGHFRYFLPVVAGKEYSVKLFFSEGWFGAGNGGPGGVGSRVFDVYCNGTTLLKDFDILRDQQAGTVTITSRHVKPTSLGVLELYFTPVKNYPLINAIEVDPEG